VPPSKTIERAKALREKSREIVHAARNARLASQMIRRRIFELRAAFAAATKKRGAPGGCGG